MSNENVKECTVSDAGGYVTRPASNRVTFTAMTRNEDCLVYWDFGTNYFSGDWVHRFEFQYSNATDNYFVVLWMVSNTVDDLLQQATDRDDYIAFTFTGNAANLRIGESGDTVVDSTAGGALSPSTTYYVTVSYDADGGGGDGRATAVIKTGSHNGTVVDTLACNRTEAGENYRYLYALNNYHDDGDSAISGFVRNIDIGRKLFRSKLTTVRSALTRR